MALPENIRIEYLADYPEFIGACAAWEYGRWGVQQKGKSIESFLNKFKKCAQKNSVPLTFVAINKYTNMPVAMGSIRETDGDRWDNVTPWISSVFTLYRFRNLGIAMSIIDRLEKEAALLGYDQIYLKSGSAAQFYVKLGYDAIETVETNDTAAGTETLLRRAL